MITAMALKPVKAETILIIVMRALVLVQLEVEGKKAEGVERNIFRTVRRKM